MPHSKGDSIEVAPFDADAAWQLYAATIGPLESQLKGVTDVVWDAVGPHAAVPPAILIGTRPTQAHATSAAQLSSLPFMTERFAFTFVPDLPLFSFYRGEHAPARPETRFVGIGAPLLSTEELAGARKSRSMDLAGGYDVRALTDMPKLPDAATELRELASVFGADRSTLLLGAEASEPAVRRMDFTGASVVAFATHGFVANEIAGVAEPALMLEPPRTPGDSPTADGLLTASELASFKFDADLVILSACNSATADGRPRADTFSGLAQSFAAAGARALLVSHWPVATGAAADLTVKTVTDSRNAHLSLARSLQKAMQDVRQEGKADPLRAHPFYWAPFALIGDGRTTLQ
jgi:CHAT domain-containing protein